MIHLYGISNILVAITSSAIAIFILAKGYKNKTNRIWSLFAFCVAIYGFGAYMASTAKDSSSAFFWWQISYIGVIMLPALFLHFVYSFLNIKRPSFIKIIYFLSFIILASDIFIKRLFVGNVSLLFTNSKWFKPAYWIYPPGPLHILHTVFFYFGLILWAHIELIKEYRRSEILRRHQIKYFFLATALGFAGGGTSYLPCFGIKIYPVLNITVALYPLIIAYAILKYRLMDITVAITRAGLSLGIYSLLFGIPFYLGYKTNSWFLSTTVAIILAAPAPLIYRYFRIKAEDLILAKQRRYQKLLLQAAGGMVIEHNLDRLLKLIVYIVKRVVRINFVAIFLQDREDKIYRLRAMRDGGRVIKPLIFPNQHPLITFIKEEKEPFTGEEIPSKLKGSLVPFHSSIGLIIPSFIEESLSGFLLLGEKVNHELYSEDDINIFKILSRQAALAIENCTFFDEFKKAQERIFTAEKLASIGGMADGVAHQIKNRLNHFSIASGELKFEISSFISDHPDLVTKNPELKKTFDYIHQIADSLINNVKRTDNIIKGILSFARTTEKETFFSQFSLKEMISLSLELLTIKHEIAEFPLKVQIKGSDIIYGVKAQLMEAVYNLLDNAYEAIRYKIDFHFKGKPHVFTPLIELRLTQTQNASVISISDNGIGIKEGHREKIFAPFFTTKSSYKSGTGIGLYVVKRMVEENHHGKLWFESEYKKGTIFHIRLPIKPRQST